MCQMRGISPRWIRTAGFAGNSYIEWALQDLHVWAWEGKIKPLETFYCCWQDAFDLQFIKLHFPIRPEIG